MAVNASLVEQWVEYGIGMTIFFLRFFARYKVVGLKNLAYDDLFALLAMVIETPICVSLRADSGIDFVHS